MLRRLELCTGQTRCCGLVLPRKHQLFLYGLDLDVLVSVASLVRPHPLHALLQSLEVAHDLALAEACAPKLRGEGASEHLFGWLVVELALARAGQLEESVPVGQDRLLNIFRALPLPVWELGSRSNVDCCGRYLLQFLQSTDRMWSRAAACCFEAPSSL